MKALSRKKVWLSAALLLTLAGCAGVPRTARLAMMPQQDPAAAQLAMARICERRGELDKAKQLYSDVLRKNPNHGSSYHRLGVIAARQGRAADADRHFEDALSLLPGDATLLSDIGYAYYLQDRLDEAETHLRRAVEADSSLTSAQNNLGLVLGQQRRYSESLAAFRKAGNEAQAHANLAFIQSQHGNLEAAEKLYSHALTLDNKMRPAAEGLIQVAQRKQLQARLEAERVAGQDEPDVAPADEESYDPQQRAAASPARLASQKRAREASLERVVAARPAKHVGSQLASSVQKAADPASLSTRGVAPPQPRQEAPMQPPSAARQVDQAREPARIAIRLDADRDADLGTGANANVDAETASTSEGGATQSAENLDQRLDPTPDELVEMTQFPIRHGGANQPTVASSAAPTTSATHGQQVRASGSSTGAEGTGAGTLDEDDVVLTAATGEADRSSKASSEPTPATAAAPSASNELREPRRLESIPNSADDDNPLRGGRRIEGQPLRPLPEAPRSWRSAGESSPNRDDPTRANDAGSGQVISARDRSHWSASQRAMQPDPSAAGGRRLGHDFRMTSSRYGSPE